MNKRAVYYDWLSLISANPTLLGYCQDYWNDSHIHIHIFDEHKGHLVARYYQNYSFSPHALASIGRLPFFTPVFTAS